VELCGADVPVHEGAERPQARELRTATFFHRGLADPDGWRPRVASEEPNVTVCWETLARRPGAGPA
jgi:inosine-uridine nucleoside N-ribohydrolase